MKPFVGAVPGANQAFLFATGVCLVTTDDETDTETGGEVPCGAPHHGFATGAGTMPETSDGEPPPSDDAFAAFAKPHCEGVATQFLGRPYQDDPTMTVSWYPILAESWRAGTRQVHLRGDVPRRGRKPAYRDRGTSQRRRHLTGPGEANLTVTSRASYGHKRARRAAHRTA